MIELADLVPLINEDLEMADLFGSAEARAAVQRMNEGNEIMFAEEVVYKV